MFLRMFKRKSIDNTGNNEFKEAKEIWQKISATVLQASAAKPEDLNIRKYDAIQSDLTKILSLLEKSARKNHYEGTRCYAALMLLTSGVRFKSHYPNPSFEDLQTCWTTINIQNALVFLSHPQFAKDEFAQYIIDSLIPMSRNVPHHIDLLERLRKCQTDDCALFMAYAIVKCHKLNFSLENIQKEFAVQAKKKILLAPEALYECLYLSLLQSRTILNELQNYTLDDARQLLGKIQHSSAPYRCEFLEMPRENKPLIIELLKIREALSQGNTRTFLPVLQQAPVASTAAAKQEESKDDVPKQVSTESSVQPTDSLAVTSELNSEHVENTRRMAFR